MAITFGTNKQMQLVHSCDSLTNITGSIDGLEGFGYNIQGTNSVTIAIRKNEVIPVTITQESGNTITVPTGSQVIAWAASSVATIADAQTMTINGSTSSSAALDVKSIMIGYFKPFAFNYNNYGTTLTSVVWTWDSSGANIRTANNIWMDAIYIGNGVDLSGTTVSDSLFLEGQTYDETSNTYNGVLISQEGIVFSQGDIFISTTTGNSFNETLVFYETLYGNNTYTLNGTGTASLANTSISVSGTITLNVDFSAMTSFSMIGGTLSGFNSLSVASGQTFNRVVCTDGNTITMGAATSRSVFDQCGQITLNGTFSNVTVSDSTVSSGVAAVVCDSINDITGGSIDTTTGNGHAIELTTAHTGSFTTSTSGYDSGVTGSPITPTEAGVNATGNETILISASSGTFNIAVGSGLTVPSVAIANGSTAVVNVTDFQPTLTLTGLIPNSEVRIYNAGTTTEFDPGIENSGTSYSLQYSYLPNTLVDIVVHNVSYKHYRVEDFLLSAQDASLPIAQIFDRNYSNPPP